MTTENSSTKLCPTCGTRISEGAARCLVCGTELSPQKGQTKPQKVIHGSRMPAITLSLPIVLFLLAICTISGGALSYYGLQQSGNIATPELEATETLTPTPSPTNTPMTPTLTLTPQPSFTPLAYTVQLGDTCTPIGNLFNISVQSIIITNNLDANCTLFVGQTLVIPHPTPTLTPLATATFTGLELTVTACPQELYIVTENDTLSMIATVYGIPMQAIMEWNGLTTDTVFLDQRLIIPLCERVYIPGSGTVTPSPAPPYSAPQLLLPLDGEAFTLAEDTVVLQWSSVGTLRENESYQVTIVDLTDGGNTSLVLEVTDTRAIVPTSLRPTGSSPHAFRWSVIPVAQIGIDEDGNPIYTPGGPPSITRIFIWSGGAPEGTPLP
ncbi:MAG: LysM peptidoglycan-binding domain-containing protein [Chloroflexi bacterium]|nr:LysM peptidoglycan-binding domain-containing protein [Chloroflexota bacterium]